MSAAEERESVTKKTHDLVETFEGVLARVERARHELNSAECALSNARNALARWLIPAEAKPGEQFNIWYGNRLISVVVDSSGRREGPVTIKEARK